MVFGVRTCPPSLASKRFFMSHPVVGSEADTVTLTRVTRKPYSVPIGQLEWTTAHHETDNSECMTDMIEGMLVDTFADVIANGQEQTEKRRSELQADPRDGTVQPGYRAPEPSDDVMDGKNTSDGGPGLATPTCNALFRSTAVFSSLKSE